MTLTKLILTGPLPLNVPRCSPMKSSSRISIAKNRPKKPSVFLGFSQCEQLGIDGGRKQFTVSVTSERQEQPNFAR
jgi:hypothetical protein